MTFQLFRRIRRDQDGVTAVEFGLLALPLMVLLMGGMDLGHQAYIKSQLQGSLSEAARRASVEDPSFSALGNTLEEQVLASLEESLAPVAPNSTYELEISNFFDFSGIGNPERIMTDIDGDGVYDEEDGDCFEDLNENGSYDLDMGRDGIGGSNDVVFYEAKLTMPRLLPMAGLLGFSENMVVETSVATRRQPFAVQQTPPIVCGTP